MAHIRAFRPQDLSAVIDLWHRAFRPAPGLAPNAVRRYFDDVFFHHPWPDEDLPSLVYEDGHGVVGFLGLIPRPMHFRDRPIRVAVCTQFMVDPDQHAGLAAFALLRRLFAGPQDLCLADGANPHAQKIWTRLGGEVALLPSLDWMKIFQPVGYALDALFHVGRGSFVHRVLTPARRVVDARAARRDPFRVPVPTGVAEETTDEGLLACLSQWSGSESLRPVYDDSVAWLLRHARARRRHGTLRQAIVRGARGEVVGWFLYYVKRGGESTVLQVRARSDSAVLVLDHLFHDARAQGATAISGQVQPELLDALATRQCIMRCRGLSVLIQSRDPEIPAAIHRGDAALSRLDGEWCLCFSDYRLGLYA